ncbi:unnamed protein product [Aureobasidium vineae]|uniref:Uncharacterized protein n=1 Tax=Aureobasidium vineae TaxID=2773715 RepID=A0A9N8P6N4_9PEZI|nr:unnamed protein product [Aureobasidium vineae]
MPAAEGIVLMLESQFDADTIPEAAIPASHASDASDDPRLVDVYVPSYLASQFWISCTINPAMLAPTHAPTKYMFFKLVLDEECIVSWGVGEAEVWKGKTMWAFFRGEDHGGWRTVDKRAFFFRPTGDDQDFDILAYRARGRRRACRQFDEQPSIGEKGFDLVNWGRLKEHHPQNFYQYALLDPLDQPYATFRYHIRSGPHIHARSSDQDFDQSSNDSYVSTADQPSRLSEELQDASQLRRLSYPPTICLVPTSSRTEPSSPTKLDAEMPFASELNMSILDPDPPITIESQPEPEQPTTESQPDALEQEEQERMSIPETVVRKYSVQTPTPLETGQQLTDTSPSSLRKRSGAMIKGWFGSISKRRATRSTSPVRPSLSHKTSSASLS